MREKLEDAKETIQGSVEELEPGDNAVDKAQEILQDEYGCEVSRRVINDAIPEMGRDGELKENYEAATTVRLDCEDTPYGIRVREGDEVEVELYRTRAV